MSLECVDSFHSWVAHAGGRKEASTSPQSPGRGGVGWGEGLGVTASTQGGARGSRSLASPQTLWSEGASPFPQGTPGEAPLAPAPLHSAPGEKAQSQLWTRCSLQFWPPLRGPLGPLQNSISVIPEVTASSPSSWRGPLLSRPPDTGEQKCGVRRPSARPSASLRSVSINTFLQPEPEPGDSGLRNVQSDPLSRGASSSWKVGSRGKPAARCVGGSGRL